MELVAFAWTVGAVMASSCCTFACVRPQRVSSDLSDRRGSLKRVSIALQRRAGVLGPVGLPLADATARPTMRPPSSDLACTAETAPFPVTSRATQSGPPL
eukprot:7391576-Prymnesium_polylepis.1